MNFKFDPNTVFSPLEFQQQTTTELQKLHSFLPSTPPDPTLYTVEDIQCHSKQVQLNQLLEKLDQEDYLATFSHITALSLAEKRARVQNSKKKIKYIQDAQKNLKNLREEVLNICCILDYIDFFTEIEEDSSKEPLKSMTLRDAHDHTNYNLVQYRNTLTKDREIKILQKLVINSDVLIHVGVYHPTQGHKTQEFIVYQEQLLTDIIEQIYCIADRLQDEKQGGFFFFIEDTFYHSHEETHSQIILAQKEDSQQKDGQFKSEKVEHVAFKDLKFVVGKPYIFRHLYNCDHMVLFQDLRLVSQSDFLDKDVYPIETYNCRLKRKLCYACKTFYAKQFFYGRMFTINDAFNDNSVVYYCEHCYKTLFNEQSKGQNQCQVYPYLHD